MSPIDPARADAVLPGVRQVLRQVQVSLDAAAAHVRNDAEAALDDILASRLLTATLLLKLDTMADTSSDGSPESGTLQSTK
jgi:hypothetical protein